jgi:hypothetical protein
MAIFMAFPVLGILLAIQLGVISRLPLLNGTADVILLALIAWALQEQVKTTWEWTAIGGILVSLLSALPSFAPLIGYVLVIGIARLFHRRVWQSPLLTMFIITFIGTVLYHGLTIGVLWLNGIYLPIGESLSQVTLPSLLLNLVFALPIYAVMTDIGKWLYPMELEA